MKQIIKKICLSTLSLLMAGSLIPGSAVNVMAEESMQTVTLIVETYYNDALYSGREFPVEVKNADTGEVLARADELVNGRAYITFEVPNSGNTPIKVVQVKGNNPLITYDETIAERVVTEDGQILEPQDVPVQPEKPSEEQPQPVTNPTVVNMHYTGVYTGDFKMKADKLSCTKNGYVFTADHVLELPFTMGKYFEVSISGEGGYLDWFEDQNNLVKSFVNDHTNGTNNTYRVFVDKAVYDQILAGNTGALDLYVNVQAEAPVDEHAVAVEQAQTAVSEAESVMNTAKAAYDAAAAQVTELEAAEPQKEMNAFGFFKEQADQTAYQLINGTYSGNLLSGNGVSYSTLVSYTSAGEGDATELTAMYNALDLIDEVNAKRAAENNEEHRYRDDLQPFKVTDSMMAVAMLTANYNQKCKFSHPQTFNTAENIATRGKGYAVDAWYGERSIFWADPEQGEVMKNMSAWDLYQNYSDIYFKVGHYLNIVDDGSPCIGLAVAGGNRMTAMDTYWNAVGSKGAYTTAEYRARLDAYASSSEESEALVNARAALETATTEYNNSIASYNAAVEALNALLGQ